MSSIGIVRAALVMSALLIPAIACTAPVPASALAVPATQRVLLRGASDARGAAASELAREHVIYGRIDAIRGSALTVRTRGGRAQLVDASQAIRSGSYSEPLFVGKIVVVTGSYSRSHILRASSLMRMGSLDAGTPPDR